MSNKEYDYNINSIEDRDKLDLTRTTLYLYSYQYDLLRDIAHDERSKMSIIVREAIDNFLKEKGKDIVEDKED